MIWCWLAKIRSTCTLTAFGRASSVGGSPEGSLSVFPTEYLANSYLTYIVVLSNLGLDVNSSVWGGRNFLRCSSKCWIGHWSSWRCRPRIRDDIFYYQSKAFSVSILSCAAATISILNLSTINHS